MRRRLLAILCLGVCVVTAPAEARRKSGPEARRATPVAAAAPAAAPTDPGAQCREAIATAERAHGTAPGLLNAIARVESGRADPRGGALTPWPWTINAEGQGRHFDSKAEALAAVRALQARGVQVIDVGCMQVNLFHHPTAFASLEQAFDPAANAAYAAQFLKRLHASAGGDWERAAAHYHSATPERGEAYKLKVMAHWPAMAGRYAELRQRDAMAVAWGGSLPEGREIRINGFQQRALALTGRPDLTGRRGTLLDPVPALRLTGQRVNGRPVFVTEIAEARR